MLQLFLDPVNPLVLLDSLVPVAPPRRIRLLKRERTPGRELGGDEVAVSVESGDGVDKEDSSEYGTCVDRKHWLVLLLELMRALLLLLLL